MTEKIQLTLTTEQAQAVANALDLYASLSMGQFEEVAALVRHMRIPVYCQDVAGREPVFAKPEVSERVHELMKEVKALMGYPGNAHHGLGHRHNPLGGTRAYEVKKVLDKVLADHRDASPSFRRVQHDGLLLRYTGDPAPEAWVICCEN